MKRIYSRYKGMTIQFPQRIFSKEYTRTYIKEQGSTMKTKEIAKALNLTERRVRQLTKELKEGRESK